MKTIARKRLWDENIGKLIMFSVTIIIAVGLVGLLTFFYNESRTSTTQMSVLWNANSTATNISDAWFCTASASNTIAYNPISGTYAITCGGWDNPQISWVRGLGSVVVGTGTWSYQIL